MNLEVFFKITQILEEIFDVPASDIRPETDLYEDLGADEYDMVELSMILEEEFRVLLEEGDLDSVYTVEDLCKFLGK